MSLNQRKLFIGKLIGLRNNTVRDKDLSHIMQKAAKGNDFQVLRGVMEPFTQYITY
jgi:hypothetical protein